MKTLLIWFLLLVVISGNTQTSPRVLYVKSSASGLANGSSWSNAYTSLSIALSNALAKDTIKVAKGTYKPGTVQTSSFILKDSVVLLGGYPDTGSPGDASRNWALNPTVLSGELGLASETNDNINTILVGNFLHNKTEINGFIIERAMAYTFSNGGGISLTGSDLVIQNCIFRDNNAYGDGTAMNIQSGTPQLSNCIFLRNTGKNTIQASANSNPSFRNCIFSDNSGINVVVARRSTLAFTNCTFFRNAEDNFSGLPGPIATIAAQDSTVLNVANSIFFGNVTSLYFNVSSQSADTTDIALDVATINISNTITQVYNTGSPAFVGANPKFKDTANIAGPDNIFFTADDGLQLSNPCSVAMNSGSNSATASAYDILGNPRIVSTAVDLGAYEVQTAPLPVPATVYVNKSATGSNDGSSWANAYTDLQKALQSCSNTIKVAAGTYYPSNNNPQSSFWLENKRILLGGYPSSGNPTDAQRNPTSNPTILSGNLPSGNGKKSLIIVRGRWIDSTVTVDGFTIRDAGRNDQVLYSLSAAIFLTYNSAPLFSNCKLTDNTNSYSLQSKSGSRPGFSNCVFDGNSTNVSGGGEVILQNGGGKFIKCQFKMVGSWVGNTTYNSGATLSIDNSNPLIDSSSFIHTGANSYGNVLFTSRHSHPIIKNSSFTGSHRTPNGAGSFQSVIYNTDSDPEFTNCIFSDSTRSQDGGNMTNVNSNPVFNLCEFRNSYAYHDGGVANNDHSNPRFISCVFANNYASNAGGVICSKNYCYPVFINCAVVGNVGGRGSFMYNERSFPQIVNSTIVKHSLAGNSSLNAGVIYNLDSARLTIQNTIFWGNSFESPNYPNLEITENGNGNAASATTMYNSVTQKYGTNGVNGNMVGINPRMFEYNDADGLDNKYFTADDGIRLTACSPLLNAGQNSFVTETSDILQNPRNSGSSVDIGAYEFQNNAGGIPHTYYVNALATGTNDGTSWANAYTSLWQGINNICADTVKVASGVYKPAMTSRDSSFLMKHGKVYLGGYPNTGNPSDADRNTVLYPTLLDGNIGAIDSSDNSLHVVNMDHVDGTLLFDGFTVINGNNTSQNSQASTGGGIAITGSVVSVRNCIIKNNFAHDGGGGIAIGNSPGTSIYHCVISGNRTIAWGGGINLNVSDGEKITIENCVIDSNYSTSSGGGAYVYGSNSFYAKGLYINNTLFYANKTLTDGGALYMNPTDKVYVTNCNFINNEVGANYRGGGIYNYYLFNQNNGFPMVANSIFYGNSLGTNQNYSGADIFDSDCPNSSCAFRPNIKYNRMQSYFGGSNNISAPPQFVNISDPDGPDNIWMTADDGLKLQSCSNLVNRGFNTSDSVIVQDIQGNPRILFGTVDIGAYENNGTLESPGAMVSVNDSAVANKEITDASGWTHYYRDCQYLLSIKKNGQNIGTVGDGVFEMKVVIKPEYGSGQAANLTTATYNTTGNSWFAMNRYWNIKPTNPVIDSILVRFPYTNQDFADLKGSNPALSTHQQIEFFKVQGTNNPFDLNVPQANFFKYVNGPSPSLTTWAYSQVDTIHVCEYYVRGFSGGSGGSVYSGLLSDLVITNAQAPSSIATNSSFTVSVTETNQGSIAAGNNKIQIYLSSDTLITPNANGDLLLGDTLLTGPLNVNSNFTVVNKSLFLPCTVSPGNYYLLFAADGNNNISEANEQNNIFSKAVVIDQGNNLPVVPVIAAFPSATACTGTTIQLTASSAACNNCTYKWSNGSTGPVVYVNTSANYTVTVTNACGSSSASQQVTLSSPPSINLSLPTGLICEGSSFTMSATGASAFTWNGPGLTSTTGSSVVAAPTGWGQINYTITGTTNGCSRQLPISVSVYPGPAVNIIQNDTTICVGASIQLQATAAAGASTLWSPAAGLNTASGTTVIATPAINTLYYLTGTTAFNCTAKDSVRINLSSSITSSVSINQTVCTGSSVTFQATPANGGNNPRYEWYVNNVLAYTGNPFVFNNAVNGKQVYVTMFPDITCPSAVSVNSSTLTVNCITTAVVDIDGVAKFSIAPNPTDGKLIVQMKLTSTKKINFEVSDNYGKKIYTSGTITGSGNYSKTIDLRSNPAGVYFLRTTIGNKTFTEKIVIAR